MLCTVPAMCGVQQGRSKCWNDVLCFYQQIPLDRDFCFSSRSPIQIKLSLVDALPNVNVVPSIPRYRKGNVVDFIRLLVLGDELRGNYRSCFSSTARSSDWNQLPLHVVCGNPPN